VPEGEGEEEEGVGEEEGGRGGSWLALPMRWKGFAVGVFFMRLTGANGKGGRGEGREGGRAGGEERSDEKGKQTRGGE